MKKFIAPLLMVFVSGVMATSCGREPVLIESVHTSVLNQEVKWTDWRAGNDHLYATFEWPALTQNVLRYGSVTAYTYYNDIQVPLPHVIPIYYTIDGEEVVVPENLRYEIEEGRITFVMQDLDGFIPEGIENSAPINFRVVATVPVEYILDK